VAREGEGAQFDSDPQERARTASSAAEQLHYMHSKKDSVCSDPIQKWVYWWASNYASPGLTVLGRRSPGPPAPAQAGTRGAIKHICRDLPIPLSVPVSGGVPADVSVPRLCRGFPSDHLITRLALYH
jgi:hypothetical protein